MKFIKVFVLVLVEAALITALVLAVSFKTRTPQDNAGSVNFGNEYHATTTFAGFQQIVHLTTTTDPLATVQGALGNIVITKAGTASFDIFDATTTDRTKRAATMTTNSIRVASFPASVAVGTYVFDEVYYNGLIIVYSSTDIPTTTLMFR